MLPCDNVDDVNKLEDWLSNNENQNLLVHYLGRIGGRSVDYAVKKLLERLFTNDLAKEYNWTGKHDKIPLKGLKILNSIYRVVQNNTGTASATECDITLKLRNWFRFSKDREGGREARRKNVQQFN